MNPESLILDKLKQIIPFKFRLGNGIGKYQEVGKRKIYEKYAVLGYIDARDAMDRLDEVVGSDWSDDYKVLKNNLYCGVTICGKTRWDCGTESNTEQEKGEASDSFKRACVKRGLGRFLYTLPRLTITSQEAKDNKYDMTNFIKNKFRNELCTWEFDSGLSKRTYPPVGWEPNVDKNFFGSLELAVKTAEEEYLINSRGFSFIKKKWDGQ